MINTLRNASVIFLCAFMMSCTTAHYSAPTKGAFATVSFSNLSPEIPSINIIKNRTIFSINHTYIEQKKPTDKSKYKTHIVPNEYVTFEYNYFWFSPVKTKYITKGDSVFIHIDIEKTKEYRSCKETVTFLPEENKHYEVYFGINSEQCIINAIEANETQGLAKKILVKINTISNHQY